MLVVNCAALLAGAESSMLEPTTTVFAMKPVVAGAVTVIAMPGAAPRAKAARVQVTTPLRWVQFQPSPAAPTYVVPAGSVSVTVIGPAKPVSSVSPQPPID